MGGSTRSWWPMPTRISRERAQPGPGGRCRPGIDYLILFDILKGNMEIIEILDPQGEDPTRSPGDLRGGF